MSALPFEVLITTFEFLLTDTSKPADLLQCQLVSKNWSNPAQHLLYTDIHIKDEIALLDYVQTIRYSIHKNLGSLAKKLTLYNYETLVKSFQFRDCYNSIAKLWGILLQCTAPSVSFYEQAILAKTRQGHFSQLGKIPTCKSHKGFVAYNQTILELREQMREINTLGCRMKRVNSRYEGRGRNCIQAAYRSDVQFPLVRILRLSEWEMMSPLDFDYFVERYPSLEFLELKSDVDHLMWIDPTKEEVRQQQKLDNSPINKALCRPRPNLKAFICNAFQTTCSFFEYFMYKFPGLQLLYRKDFCFTDNERTSQCIDIKAKWIHYVTNIPRHYYEFHHAWDAKDVLYAFFKLAAVYINNKPLFMGNFEISYDIFELRKSPCLRILNAFSPYGPEDDITNHGHQTKKISLLYPPSKSIEDIFQTGSENSQSSSVDDYQNETIPHKELLDCVGPLLSHLTLKNISEWEHHADFKTLLQHTLIQCPNLNTLIIERGAEVYLDDFLLPPLHLHNLTIRSCMINSTFFQILSSSLLKLSYLTIDCCFINNNNNSRKAKMVILINLASTSVGTIEYIKYWKREGIVTHPYQATTTTTHNERIKYYLKLETMTNDKRESAYYFSDFSLPQATSINDKDFEESLKINDPKTTTWFHIKCLELKAFCVDVGELKDSPKKNTIYFT
ncbi:uncharacterized protein BX663DRAFT_518798 [Cokeromyces recurvatus]|uniref:uncharacterized protein n=1 Tax=Cokeromyces recurvatus TaxID=90255 RepID=UPI00221EDD05|nr:uncharacterized protein BX663DRAFT_522375 [Cokeromyces recurvatus]XP_051380143.1 uncharacterized protein BX663DRAFT_518798 [Cokeromyces recurvatus]KAI7899126.1 hypothetical protein BX663DRAFT_522375 [Cokeromyces recurvatus]KAI7900158.1 hypothetical protein BX663DRAFT_518798 [Cokeromyces recurvatus]